MRKFRVTVYQSYTYEIEAETEQEASNWQDCPEIAYEFINDNGIEPLDFGTDDVTVEELKMSQELTSNWKVEASDGSYYYYQAYDIGEVRDKFNENHPNLEVLTIYLEVYGGQI